MNYLENAFGTPVLPNSYIFIYILFVLLVFISTYIFSKKTHYKKLQINTRRLLLFFIAANIQILLFVFILAVYILIPAPEIIQTALFEQNSNYNTETKFEIVFNKPLKRKLVSKEIKPDIAGVWIFKDPIYKTHLYRKLVFYPYFSLNPDTQYLVKIKNIKNFLQINSPKSFNLFFETEKPADILNISLEKTTAVNTESPDIVISLSKEKSLNTDFVFSISPFIPFTTKQEKPSQIIISPKSPFIFDKEYHLTVQKYINTRDLISQKVIKRKKTEEVTHQLQNDHVLGITTLPNEENIPVNHPFEITFSQEMNQNSVEDNFRINPASQGEFVWKNNKTLSFKPKSRWLYDRVYTITILKNAKSVSNKPLDKDIVKTLKTIGPVRINGVFPENKWTGVAVDTDIRITFNQEVNRQTAEKNFSISPQMKGAFSWQGNTLVFVPDNHLSSSSKYQIKINKGVKGLKGLDLQQSLISEFFTQDHIFKIKVPIYLQEKPLSCEAASLRMVLAYRGINVSENTLIKLIGTDPTVKDNKIWGNPYVNFVGDVNGRQMVNGYGVYWKPISRTANNYRYAESFENWDIVKLTENLQKNNPIIIWAYSKNGTPTKWWTKNGDEIYAVRGEHSVVVTGFIGANKNPEYIIINDPLIGEVYWTRNDFVNKWNVFGRSGVIIY